MSELVLTGVWSPPLKNFSARLGAGLHVVLGADADGTASLIELCAGVRVPRRGVVSFEGERPFASPRLRRRIASLLPVEELSGRASSFCPELVPGFAATPARQGHAETGPRGTLNGAPGCRASAGEWLRAVAALRGFSPGPALELAALDLALERSVESLSSAERRQLALALALGAPEPPLVALHEPLAASSALSRERVLGRLAELACSAVLLVTTGSVADARQLGGDLYVLERGVLARRHSHAWPSALTPGLAARLWLQADSPRELVAELARQPDVSEARYVDDHIELRGSDLERLALAVSQAAVKTGVHVRSLRSDAPDLEAVHGASAGLAHAAYRAAQQQRPNGPRPVGTNDASSAAAPAPGGREP